MSVEPDGPAEHAGLMLGDILLAMQGKVIEDTNGLMAFLDADSVGRQLTVDILRGGQLHSVPVVVGARPGKE